MFRTNNKLFKREEIFMSEKYYALKIENSDHALLFHFTFTPEEAKNTKVSIGTIESVLPHGLLGEEHHIECKTISIIGMHRQAYKDDQAL